MVEIILGFLSGLVADFFRGFLRVYAARTDAAARGRMENQNNHLCSRLKEKHQAQKIGERVDCERNLNNMVDNL